MKRASFAILALLVGGCHPSPTVGPAKAAIDPERTNVTAAAYTFARRCVLDNLARRPGPDARGWIIPATSLEAWILRDNVDLSLYTVTFSGSKPGADPRSWVVTLRRVGDEWTLVKIEEAVGPDQPSQTKALAFRGGLAGARELRRGSFRPHGAVS